MPRARVQLDRYRHRFDLLDDSDDDKPGFALGPSILLEGARAAAAAPLAPPSLQPPTLPTTSTLHLQTTFADLARELQTVSAAAAAAAAPSLGGGGGQAGGWDLSAFSAAPQAGAGVQGAQQGSERKRVVLDAMHRAYTSEAGAVSEKLHRQELSSRRRGKLLTSIMSAEAYKGRSESKTAKKQAARRRLMQARSSK